MIKTLSGQQIGQLLNALLDAYPSRDDLRIMVRIELDETLEAIADGANQRVVTFNLVTWAVRSGRIEDLLEAGRRGNPGNPALAALADMWQVSPGGTGGGHERSAPLPIPPGPAAIDVVLSYSHQDNEARRKVEAGLRAAGLAVWTDEVLEVGTPNLTSAIEEAVAQAAAMVVLLSPAAKMSAWVDREVKRAQTHGKRVFPILVTGDEFTAVPFSLRDTRWADGRQGLDLAMKLVLPALLRYLGREAVDNNNTAPNREKQTIATARVQPERMSTHGDGLQHAVTAFLKAHSLSYDPFTPIVDTIHPHSDPAHLHWVWISPNWFTRLKDRSSIIVADSLADSIAWAANLPGELSIFDHLNSRAFTLAGIVESMNSDYPSNATLLDALCRIAADGWLEIIAKDPNTFLSQSADKINALLDLLLWHCVDVGRMLQRLDVYSVPPGLRDDDRQLKLLLEIFIGQRARQRHRIADPPPLQYVEWLSIRPPGLDEEMDITVILALLRPSLSVFQIQDVELLAQQLKGNRVFFHLVGERPTVEQFGFMRIERLLWTNEEIQAMIDARIAAAGAPNGPQTFADLTDDISLGETSPYAYLWEAAQGSLHRALEYCRFAVDIHQKSGASDRFSEETLRCARDEVNRDES